MIELDSDSIKFADADSLYEALFFTLEAILPNQDENRLSPRHAVLPKGKGELWVCELECQSLMDHSTSSSWNTLIL